MITETSARTGIGRAAAALMLINQFLVGAAVAALGLIIAIAFATPPEVRYDLVDSPGPGFELFTLVIVEAFCLFPIIFMARALRRWRVRSGRRALAVLDAVGAIFGLGAFAGMASAEPVAFVPAVRSALLVLGIASVIGLTGLVVLAWAMPVPQRGRADGWVRPNG